MVTGDRIRLGLCAVVAVAAVVAAGCKDSEVSAPKVKPVTKAQANALAGKLQAALQPCEASAVTALIDMRAMVTLAAARSKANDAMKRGFIQGAVKSGGQVARQLCKDKRTKTKLLRVTKVLGKTKVLFRATGVDGFNYIEFYVGTSETGAVLAYDIYFYLSGERFSESLRRLLDTVADDKSAFAYAEQLKATMAAVQQLGADKRYAEARAKFQTLPAALRDNQSMLLQDLLIAANMDEGTYLAAIAAFEKRFPDAPALDMVSLDGFYLRKQFDKAIAVIVRLKRRIGGDPYLDQLQAGMLFEQRKYTDARPLLQSALAAEPQLQDTYWKWATLLIVEGKFAEAVKTFKRLDTEFAAAASRTGLLGEPLYADFVKSPEGTAFMATLSAN